MTYREFKEKIERCETPVILLEGSRKVDPEIAPRLTALAAFLACEHQQALFRSGNADGSDQLFAEGVNQVDPVRLQLVTPTATHRRAQRHESNYVMPLSSIAVPHEEDLARKTGEASPKNKGLMDIRHQSGRGAASAKYLLRDTLKVVGDPEQGLAPAAFGIFYTHGDPMSGGTGHTIRVCFKHHTPHALQHDWLSWLVAT